MNAKVFRAIGIAMAAALTMLVGCAGVSTSQSVVDPAARRAASAGSPSLGDGENGCYPVEPTNTGPGGFVCRFSGSPSTIDVPGGENISTMTLNLAGGQGGSADPADGGFGAAITGTVPVSGGQQLTIAVGGGASNNTPGSGAGTPAGGGAGGCSDGGGGGGASSVAVDGVTVAVAGGGGGGGAQGIMPKIDDGGNGGTSTDGQGDGSGGDGPGSGDKGSGGASGTSLSVGGNGGGGGAGGNYFVSTATNVSSTVANVGGDGSIIISWNN